MRHVAPLVLVSLAGCFYISAEDEDSRLAWLDSADTGAAPPFEIRDFEPTVVSACTDPFVFAVEGEVDGAHGGAEFGTLVAWDDEPFEVVGKATADAAFEGRARVAFTLESPQPDAVDCADDWCDHALTVGLSGPAELQATLDEPIRVVVARAPAVAAFGLVDPSGAVTPFASAAPSSTPANAFRTAEWPEAVIGLDLPFVAAGGAADYTVELWSCPDGVDPANDTASACLVASAAEAGVAVDGDLVVAASTGGFGAAGCAEAGKRHLFARVSGDPCADGAFLALGDARFAAADCDADGVDTPSDCDDEDTDIGAGTTYYPDVDEDGLGDEAGKRDGCATPAGWLTIGTDCDDTDPDVGGPLTWYNDGDDDGLGDATDTWESCTAPAGFVADASDCDDTKSTTGGPTSWWPDADGDGFGGASSPESACVAPLGSVGNPDDCADADGATHPGAEELCDGLDNDCDTAVDDAAIDATKFFADGDGDAFGDDAVTVVACTAPSGAWALQGGDCGLTDALTYPGAPEVCSVAQMAAGTDVNNDCDANADAIDCGTCVDTQLSPAIGETDVDCGGQCDLGCGYAQTCAVDADCGSGACDGVANECGVWSVLWQGNNIDGDAHVALAPDGDIVLAGSTDSSSVDVGGVTPLGAGPGGGDIVVARYSPDGQLRWGRRLGSAGRDWLGDVAVDDVGNVIVVGSFSGTGLIDGFPAVSKGGLDVLVATLDAAGATTNVDTYGTAGDDYAHGLAFDDVGRTVVAGRSGTGLAERGFVATLGDQATVFSGSGGARVSTVSRHPSGDLLVGGYYGEGTLAGRSSLDVTRGAGAPATYLSVLPGTLRDGFVARLSRTDGSVVWLRTVEGMGGQEVFDVAALAGGDVVLGGRFEQITRVSDASQLLTSVGRLDAMVARLTGATGAHQWSKGWGSTGQDGVSTVVIGGGDRPIVGYWYGGDHDTDPGLSVRNLVGFGPSDTALSVFDPANGAWLSGASYVDRGYQDGDHDDSAAFDVAANPATGQVVVGGSLDGWLDVGDGRKRDALSTPPVYMGSYVASLGPSNWPSSLPQKDGFDASRAAASCSALHAEHPAVGNGAYWIDPDGTGPDAPYRAACEMALEGGGWTRVVAQVAGDLKIVCDPLTVTHTYDYTVPLGTVDDVADAARTAWLAPGRVAKLPTPDRSVLVVLDTTSSVRPHPYNVFRSSNAGFSWTAIANGQVTPATVGAAGLAVEVNRNGHGFQAMIGHGNHTLPLTGLYPPSNLETMAVGAGFECRGDASGLWSGSDPESWLAGGAGSGAQWFPGAVYVR